MLRENYDMARPDCDCLVGNCSLVTYEYEMERMPRNDKDQHQAEVHESLAAQTTDVTDEDTSQLAASLISKKVAHSTLMR